MHVGLCEVCAILCMHALASLYESIELVYVCVYIRNNLESVKVYVFAYKYVCMIVCACVHCLMYAKYCIRT